MTKARDIADFKFENIVDTGTEGTKVASGTTAQRGSTAGQWRFNSTIGFYEGYNGIDFVALAPTPTISSVSPNSIESASGGNVDIVIQGTNFDSGTTVNFIGNDGTNFNASSVTLNSSIQITATVAKSSFVNSKEPYDVKVTSNAGIATTGDDLINVDNNPTWTTASGSLGNVYETQNDSFQVTATDADGDTITYSVLSGSLPSGYSLNTSTGAITGTAPSVSGDTTSSFTIRATANSVNADRAFSITVKNLAYTNIDIVTYASDNCSDSGSTSPSTVTHDFGTPRYVGRTYFYSVFAGGARSANVSVQYSDNNSSWTTAFSGVHDNQSSCGIKYDTSSQRSFTTVLGYGAHRYWRFVEGSAIVSHYPRAGRIGFEVIA
jgi:hypothetical protein